jgi:uncharacterized membrane protein
VVTDLKRQHHATRGHPYERLFARRIFSQLCSQALALSGRKVEKSTKRALEEKAPDASPPGGGRDAYDLGRLLTFTDGVFAIAITLLVLAIPVPGAVARPSNAELGSQLLTLAPNLLGFVLSFYVIGTQWRLHHVLLRDVRRVDSLFLSLNLLLLLFICLLPFTTAVLVRYDVAVAVDMYAANVALTALTTTAIRFKLNHTPSLLDPVTTTVGRRTYLRGLAQAAIFVVSIPLAWLNVDLAYGAWLLAIPVSRLAIWRGRA